MNTSETILLFFLTIQLYTNIPKKTFSSRKICCRCSTAKGNKHVQQWNKIVTIIRLRVKRLVCLKFYKGLYKSKVEKIPRNLNLSTKPNLYCNWGNFFCCLHQQWVCLKDGDVVVDLGTVFLCDTLGYPNNIPAFLFFEL